ncbi:MAG TPA: hypothetical protein VG847_00975 [Chitinophagaceae bacterium]|nr:hypothetical protein [Chitinophagaceae bacterium]
MQNFSGFFINEKITYAPPLSMFKLTLKENWNGKLFTHCFNELVLYTPEYSIGAVGDVFLNETHMGMVKVVQSRSLPFSRISDTVSYLNIGMPVQYQAQHLNVLYNNGNPLPADTVLLHIVLAYVKRNVENQSVLINQYWNNELIKAKA